MSTNRAFSPDTDYQNSYNSPRRGQSPDQWINHSKQSLNQDRMFYTPPDRYSTPERRYESRDHRVNQTKSPASQDRMFYVVSVNQKTPTSNENFQAGDYNNKIHNRDKIDSSTQDTLAETGSVTFEHSTDHLYNRKNKTKKKIATWKLLIGILILLLLVLGIALLAVFLSADKTKTSEPKVSQTKENPECKASLEYQKCGLGSFLEKLRESFYKLQPQSIALKPGVTGDEVREKFRPFDPTPSGLKRLTDQIRELYEELELVVNKCSETALKVRERRAIDEARYLLKYNFGRPYGRDYYNGDWLLSPNIYCWQDICFDLWYLSPAISAMKPKSREHVTKLKEVLEQQKNAILQYKQNIMLGVKTGMVRPQKACKAGLYAIKDRHPSIAIHGETGILKEPIGTLMLNANYLSDLSKTDASDWLRDNGENVTMSLRRYLVDYVGKPLHDLLRYLEFEHMFKCVPETVFSGFATLPVSYEYSNGAPNYARPTTKTLPTGETLNGSAIYKEYIFPFFTSNGITIEKALELAQSHLKTMYDQAVAIAKQQTSESDDAEAVRKFREKLESREMFYNEKPFPAKESDEAAFLKCRENTKSSCPERWQALQKWMEASTKAAKLYQSKSSEVFYSEPGPKKMIPKCGVTRLPAFNAFSSYHSYGEGNVDCSYLAQHYFPFFLDNYGPVYDLHTVTIHEVALGHHLEVQGFKENFKENCSDMSSWLNAHGFVSPFTEGWASYSEFQIGAKDLDVMKNDPIQMYGSVRRQIIIALRCIIDIGLHYNGLGVKDALDLLDKWAWVTGTFARKEITRYQSVPAATITYFLGQTDFLEARKYAEEKLGSAFSLREVHYRMLHLGDTTLLYMKNYVKRYVDCVKDKTKDGCDELVGEGR